MGQSNLCEGVSRDNTPTKIFVVTENFVDINSNVKFGVCSLSGLICCCTSIDYAIKSDDFAIFCFFVGSCNSSIFYRIVILECWHWWSQPWW